MNREDDEIIRKVDLGKPQVKKLNNQLKKAIEKLEIAKIKEIDRVNNHNIDESKLECIIDNARILSKKVQIELKNDNFPIKK
jgi:hypothetical protein